MQIAIQHGDLDRLMVPTDSQGRKCGVDNGVINKPYLLFFNLEECIDPRVPLFGCKTPQVCVEKCPTESFVFSEFSCNPSNVQKIHSQLICKMGVKVEPNCADIIEKVERKKDCARWYLPSNSCKLLPIHVYMFLLFYFVHQYVSIIFICCSMFVFAYYLVVNCCVRVWCSLHSISICSSCLVIVISLEAMHIRTTEK